MTWEYCELKVVPEHSRQWRDWLLWMPIELFIGREYRWSAIYNDQIIGQSSSFRVSEDQMWMIGVGQGRRCLEELKDIMAMRGWERIPGEDLKLQREIEP